VSSELIGGSGLAGRYAAALFDLADDSRALDGVLEDLTRLQAMIDDSDDLRRMIRSPVLSREAQGAAISAIVGQAGFSDLTGRFVGLVARNRRLFALEDMIRAFRALLSARRGEVTAEVTTAARLGEAQLAALEAALRESVGARVAIEQHVDPGILGGMIVKIGSKMVDSSLRTKLQKLEFAMKGAA